MILVISVCRQSNVLNNNQMLNFCAKNDRKIEKGNDTQAVSCNALKFK